MQPVSYPPHQIAHDDIVLILATTVIIMQNEIPFAQTMNFKKCVKERYDSIGPFSCCHGFINDVLICLGIPSHHTPNKPALRAVNLNANITLK